MARTKSFIRGQLEELKEEIKNLESLQTEATSEKQKLIALKTALAEYENGNTLKMIRRIRIHLPFSHASQWQKRQKSALIFEGW
ncbi:hypothetical protein FNH22_29105 [Fulvivirga sp. M361]|uniref:hypothetical protein n=1 Tax=Fulvivirga sp. M361 TaxID=2594266 RepID=UPI00117AD6D2|nr:hypothetical protein [Fulvivirga sp. M361]TRX48494.1 hypothetical protein FNH22_29105 [Fulvivirga sp. M361]